MDDRSESRPRQTRFLRLLHSLRMLGRGRVGREEELAELEAQLRDSEDRFRRLVENSLDAILITAPEGRILAANPAACRMFRGSEADLQAAGRNGLVDLDDPRLTRAVEERARTGRFSGELSMRRLDGEIFPAEITTGIFEDRGGEKRTSMIIRDITGRKRTETALAESEARFRSLLETIPTVAVQGYGMDGITRYWNQASERFYGYTAEEAIGRSLLDLIIPPEMHEDVTRAIRQMGETGEPIPAAELSLMRKDRTRVTVFSSHASVQVPGHGTELFCVDVDLTERERIEQALLSRVRQQELIASLGGTALSGTDLDALFSEAASAVAEGLGVAFSRVMLRDTERATFLAKAGMGWQTGWLARENETSREPSQLSFVLDARAPIIVDDYAGETRFTPSPLLASHDIASGIDVPIVGVEEPFGVLGAYAREARKFSTDDIAFVQSLANTLSAAIERCRTDERLAYMAHHDALTELPNRLLLNDRLKVAIAQAERSGKRLALMFVDLDRFKSVNDIHGHDLGDRVLRELATRITSCVRGTDTVSRQGGDEFVILLPEIDSQEDALPVAEKLLAALEAPLLMDDIEIVLSASIGIACFPQDGRDPETLLRHADDAMYLAKSRGRDRYQFYSVVE